MGINGHSASVIPSSDAHASCQLLAPRENCESPPSPATSPPKTRAADFIKSLRRIFFLPPLVLLRLAGSRRRAPQSRSGSSSPLASAVTPATAATTGAALQAGLPVKQPASWSQLT